MAEEKKSTRRKKPSFIRRDWHKKIRLGSTIKKKRKWRAAKGRQNKIRLNRKGYAKRPRIGWGSAKEIKNKVQGLIPLRVENLNDLKGAKRGQGIIIASVGKKKRQTIISKAGEMKLEILNKYKEKK